MKVIVKGSTPKKKKKIEAIKKLIASKLAAHKDIGLIDVELRDINNALHACVCKVELNNHFPIVMSYSAPGTRAAISGALHMINSQLDHIAKK